MPKIASASSVRPAPTSTGNADHFARPDLEADIVEHVAAEVGHLEHRRRRCASTPARACGSSTGGDEVAPGSMASTSLSVVSSAVGARRTKAPSRSTLIWSEISSTSLSRCEMNRMPMPRALRCCICWNRLSTSRTVSDEVGSSRISTWALRRSPRRISTSCWLAMLRKPPGLAKSASKPVSRARRFALSRAPSGIDASRRAVRFSIDREVAERCAAPAAPCRCRGDGRRTGCRR